MGNGSLLTGSGVCAWKKETVHVPTRVFMLSASSSPKKTMNVNQVTIDYLLYQYCGVRFLSFCGKSFIKTAGNKLEIVVFILARQILDYSFSTSSFSFHQS